MVVGLETAVEDCLNLLDALNRELNGDVPSVGVVHVESVPLSLVYSIAEILRMIRDSQDQARNPQDAGVLARALWRVETAWLGVLAGDVDDILKHVELEEAARFI